MAVSLCLFSYSKPRTSSHPAPLSIPRLLFHSKYDRISMNQGNSCVMSPSSCMPGWLKSHCVTCSSLWMASPGQAVSYKESKSASLGRRAWAKLVLPSLWSANQAVKIKEGFLCKLKASFLNSIPWLIYFSNKNSCCTGKLQCQ